MPYQIRLQPDYLIRPRGGGIIPLRGDVARKRQRPLRGLSLGQWPLCGPLALFWANPPIF